MNLLTNGQQKSSTYICGKKFEDKKKYCKVGDHCYYTGEYRGVAHYTCVVYLYKVSYT